MTIMKMIQRPFKDVRVHELLLQQKITSLTNFIGCLEVPSPTLDFYPNSEWIEGIKDHWKLLLKFGIAHINHNCATHVHIWPKGKKDWSLDQLKQIAKAVIYFEKAFEVISAPSRRNHDHTRHNKASNPELKDLEFAECCERIRKCTNNLELISTMQPGDSKAKAPTYAWNFMNTDRCFDEDIDDPEDEPVGTIGASDNSWLLRVIC